MTVHHLSAPNKGELIAQIKEITEAAGERSLRVQMLHPTGAGYKAIVTVEGKGE